MRQRLLPALFALACLVLFVNWPPTAPDHLPSAQRELAHAGPLDPGDRLADVEGTIREPAAAGASGDRGQERHLVGVAKARVEGHDLVGYGCGEPIPVVVKYGVLGTQQVA